MSSGFKIADKVYWGTNGAIEEYVLTLTELITKHCGVQNPDATHLREYWELFQAGATGMVVSLDGFLENSPRRRQFVGFLDAETEQIKRKGIFTEYGLRWIDSVITEMRSEILRDVDVE